LSHFHLDFHQKLRRHKEALVHSEWELLENLNVISSGGEILMELDVKSLEMLPVEEPEGFLDCVARTCLPNITCGMTEVL
jgi:hypothetical protein